MIGKTFRLDADMPLNLIRFAIGGYPYHVRFFLGDVSQEGPTFAFGTTPTQIGHIYNFSGPTNARGATADGCDNCKDQLEEHALTAGQVVLTDYLVENIAKQRQQRGLTLETLSRQEVIQYLRTNLHWRITDVSTSIHFLILLTPFPLVANALLPL